MSQHWFPQRCLSAKRICSGLQFCTWFTSILSQQVPRKSSFYSNIEHVILASFLDFFCHVSYHVFEMKWKIFFSLSFILQGTQSDNNTYESKNLWAVSSSPFKPATVHGRENLLSGDSSLSTFAVKYVQCIFQLNWPSNQTLTASFCFAMFLDSSALDVKAWMRFHALLCEKCTGSGL